MGLNLGMWIFDGRNTVGVLYDGSLSEDDDRE